MPYTPSAQILKKYADVLVKYALGGGTGIKPGDVVFVMVPESAKPMYVPLRNSVLEAGGHPIMQYHPDDVDLPGYYAQASDDQLNFFAHTYYRGMVDQADHSVMIIAEYNKRELEGVDPHKLMQRAVALKPYREWRQEKESQGKFTWTLAMYGTPAMAEDVGLTEAEYWDQIIKACFLESEDPIAEWKRVYTELDSIKQKLNSLDVDTFHVEGADADLWIKSASNRMWLGGGGRNIPSFELFTSPDWRGTEGWISFNQPLYYMGTVIRGIRLEFKKGVVVNASATENEHVLKAMIAQENADKVGEFSLTDGRFSHITHVMGETLFDENIGGEQGNTHIALGSAYQDSYTGDTSTVTKEQWKEWGYNESAIHTDIISTTKRKVTAHLTDGTEVVIYEDGKFTV